MNTMVSDTTRRQSWVEARWPRAGADADEGRQELMDRWSETGTHGASIRRPLSVNIAAQLGLVEQLPERCSHGAHQASLRAQIT